MKDARRDMHADFQSLAETLVDQHIVQYDGETCFNIFTYLESLENRINELMWDAGAWGTELGRFELNASQITRYLWACIAIKHEGKAYPTVFRGMPTLD